MRKTLLLLVPVALLGACTWGINLDDAGKNVHTAWNGDVSRCRELGKVTVSVASRVGPINRNDLKIRDELEVMARNEAGKMRADTIKPLAEPSDGTQPWGAYACGGRSLSTASDASAPASSKSESASGAQTFPVKGG